MSEQLQTSAIIVSGLATLGFLLRWLFGRAEKTLDGIAKSVSDLVGTVGAQSSRIAVLEAKVEMLEREISTLQVARRSG